MIVKINKKFYAKIYFNQLQGNLLLNGRLLKTKSITFKIFINFLNSLSISVNIISNRKNKVKKISNKLLLKISNKINKKAKKEIYVKNDNDINIKKNNDNDNYKSIFNIKNYLFIILIFLVFIFVFIYDYKSIEAKINQNNYLEIKKIESDYKINKCEINGDLPSLKQKCELMLSQIELIKMKKPSLISVFFIWLMDIFNVYFTTFNLINCFIMIIFIIVVYKLLK